MILTNTIPMKATDIKTIEDAQRYIEGCMNDLDAGISTKQETIDYFAEYTLQIVKMAKNALTDSKEKYKCSADNIKCIHYFKSDCMYNGQCDDKELKL